MFIDINKYSRWQAFTSHLLVSAVVFLVLLTIIVFVWYPGDLLKLGGWRGIQIVAGIDLVLGPVLTLIVFNPAKKSLLIDLIVVAFVQVSALTYGIYTIFNEKPEVVVLSHDGIHVVAHGDTKRRDFDNASLREFSIKKPAYAILDLPSTKEEAMQVDFLTGMTDGIPLHFRVDLYRNPNNISEIDLYTRLFDFTSNENCLVAPINNKHLTPNVRACLRVNPFPKIQILKE